MSTNDVALNRLAAVSRQRPTAEELATQLGIDRTMVEVIRDPRKDPTARPIPEHEMREMTTKPLPYLGNELLVVPKRSGWVEPQPLASPPGQAAIERLANEMLPHGREFGKLGSAVSPSVVAPQHAAVEVVDRDGEDSSHPESSPSSVSDRSVSPLLRASGDVDRDDGRGVMTSPVIAPKRRKVT